jgi:SAM-dependent methyltransferase
MMNKAPESKPVEEVTCNLCGSDKRRLWRIAPVQRFGPPGEFELVQCRECGLVYVNPRPSPEEIKDYYPDAYRETRASLDEALRRWYQEDKLHKLQAHGKGGRLLDVGCGEGLFLHLARQAGWEVQGVEIAGPSAAYARDVLRLDVFGGDLLEASFPARHFDAVTFWHVLEHLHDPLRELREAHRILKPGGLLIVGAPNVASWQARLFGARWTALDVPRHLYHFSPDSLRAMLERAGFTCFKIGYWSRGHNMGRLDEHIMSLIFRLLPKSASELQSPRAFGTGLARYVRYAAFLPLRWCAFAGERLAALLGRGGSLEAYARKNNPLDAGY